MHNHLSYVSHPLKAMYQMWCFTTLWFQSRNVNIISVSDEMRKFVERWQLRALHNRRIQYIPNGIDLSRVLNKRKPRISDDKFIFWHLVVEILQRE